VFRSALRPRSQAGRKPDCETVRAAELWRGGMLRYTASPKKHPSLKRYQRGLWPRIYREVFPDFAHRDKLTRQYRTNALRRNVKAYLNRNGRKGRRGIRVSTAMPAAKCALFSPGEIAAH
jgi:hypothetical protein